MCKKTKVADKNLRENTSIKVYGVLIAVNETDKLCRRFKTYQFNLGTTTGKIAI